MQIPKKKWLYKLILIDNEFKLYNYYTKKSRAFLDEIYYIKGLRFIFLLLLPLI